MYGESWLEQIAEGALAAVERAIGLGVPETMDGTAAASSEPGEPPIAAAAVTGGPADYANRLLVKLGLDVSSPDGFVQRFDADDQPLVVEWAPDEALVVFSTEGATGALEARFLVEAGELLLEGVTMPAPGNAIISTYDEVFATQFMGTLADQGSSYASGTAVDGNPSQLDQAVAREPTPTDLMLADFLAIQGDERNREKVVFLASGGDADYWLVGQQAVWASERLGMGVDELPSGRAVLRVEEGKIGDLMERLGLLEGGRSIESIIYAPKAVPDSPLRGEDPHWDERWIEIGGMTRAQAKTRMLSRTPGDPIAESAEEMLRDALKDREEAIRNGGAQPSYRLGTGLYAKMIDRDEFGEITLHYDLPTLEIAERLQWPDYFIHAMREYLQDPQANIGGTWDQIKSMHIPGSPGMQTVWSRWCEVNPKAPKTGPVRGTPKELTEGTLEGAWSLIPTPEEVRRIVVDEAKKAGVRSWVPLRLQEIPTQGGKPTFRTLSVDEKPLKEVDARLLASLPDGLLARREVELLETAEEAEEQVLPARESEGAPEVTAISPAIWSAWEAAELLRSDLSKMAGTDGDDFYRRLMEDPERQGYWQDVLDHALQNRLIQVRNALRELDWEGERFAPLRQGGDGALLGGGHHIYVGAGRNLVQVVYAIRIGKGDWMTIEDWMDCSAEGMADRVHQKALELRQASEAGGKSPKKETTVHESNIPDKPGSGRLSASTLIRKEGLIRLLSESKKVGEALFPGQTKQCPIYEGPDAALFTVALGADAQRYEFHRIDLSTAPVDWARTKRGQHWAAVAAAEKAKSAEPAAPEEEPPLTEPPIAAVEGGEPSMEAGEPESPGPKELPRGNAQIGHPAKRVANLLHALGVDERILEGDDFLARVRNAPFLDLVIERQLELNRPGCHRLYLTHYYDPDDYNGDLVVESGLEFVVDPEGRLVLDAVIITGGQRHGPDVTFANMMSKNLLEQGFDKGQLTIESDESPPDPTDGGGSGPESGGEPGDGGAGPEFEPEAGGGGSGPALVGDTAIDGVDQSPDLRLALVIKAALEEGRDLHDWRVFQRFAEGIYGGTVGQGAFEQRQAYEAMELGVNLWIAEGRSGTDLERLAEALRRLPTQTVRDQEQVDLQQFSTPPTHAAAMAWVANIQPEDVVVEPSAGIGSLVAAAKVYQPARIIANEFSSRRAQLLNHLGVEIHQVDARLLHSTLGHEFDKQVGTIRPSLILMNPPFTADAFRPGAGRTNAVAQDHVEQALKLLSPGGRLVALVGRGMTFDASTCRNWWRGIREQYAVLANVGIEGEEYRAYGTSFDNRLLVIDKPQNPGDVPEHETIIGEDLSLVEVMRQLEEVRNAREFTSPEPWEPARTARGARSAATLRPTVPVAAADHPGSDRPAGGRPGAGAVDRGDAPRTAARGGVAVSDGDPGTPAEGISGRGRTAIDESGRDRGVAGSAHPGADGRGDAGAAGSTLKVATGQGNIGLTTEGEGGIFAEYHPALRIEGAAEHPAHLTMSASMASVPRNLASVSYRPSIPRAVITDGRLSGVQLETIVLAGHRHEQPYIQVRKPGVDLGEEGNYQLARPGFLLGDGTGVGKGRQAAGLILDNREQGRKKAIWLTESRSLATDARRDVAALGMDPKLIFELGSIKASAEIPHNEGILVGTYATLRSAERVEAGSNRTPKTRIEQIVDWVGEHFDGMLILDECHNLANATSTKGTRGRSKPSQAAMAGIELQRRLPHARVAYFSATSATEPGHLAAAERLGVWGPGTAFPDFPSFRGSIETGGVAAMEMVALDLYGQGKLLARTQSQKGVTFDTLQHPLTEEQRASYDRQADAWQLVLENVEEALETSAGAKSGAACSAARSAFWSANQLYWNQVLTGMQMPSVLRSMERDLEAGRAVVIQLTNTNEAVQERALARAAADELPLEELDLTPRDVLLQFVENSFPVFQYRVMEDSEGKPITVLVTDAEGLPVINPEAEAMRERLLITLATLPVPSGPLEQILNHFGPKRVSEVTGRKRRVYQDPESRKAVEERRTGAMCDREAAEFQAGRRDILVFSAAGATGRSFHADRDSGSADRRRIHYLAQPGWNAMKALQGLGRTHRTNEASQPHYRLVTTDVKAQARFISTIARRLEQLGALTTGERRSTSKGLFSPEMALENTYGQRGLENLLRDIIHGRVEGVDENNFSKQFGLALRDKDGDVLDDLTGITVPRFLNRLLSVRLATADRVFEAFMERVELQIRYARQEGTYDLGTEDLVAQEIQKREDLVVRDGFDGRGETRWVTLELKHPARFQEFDRVPDDVVWKRNTQSGVIYGFRKTAKSVTLADGSVSETWMRYGIHGVISVTTNELRSRYRDPLDLHTYQPLTRDQIRDDWDRRVAAAPQATREEVHMVVGALLPIYDRLPEGRPKIRRATVTGSQEALLGRVISPGEVMRTKKALGIDRTVPQRTPAEWMERVLCYQETLELSNGATLRPARVRGELRVEVTDVGWSLSKALEELGVVAEYANYKVRRYIPTEGDVIEKVLANNDVIEVTISGAMAQDRQDAEKERIAMADEETTMPEMMR